MGRGRHKPSDLTSRSQGMLRLGIRTLAVIMAVWALMSVCVGLWVIPQLLLNAPMPRRTEAIRARTREDIQATGGTFTLVQVQGGEGKALGLWHLRRTSPRGALIYLHGFGDDVWGTLGRAKSLPEWDAIGFTFRGRDTDPSAPCTLGGWERKDVLAAFHYLESAGFPPNRILIAGWSMGAGVALLALEDLEKEGKTPGGALLECPFEDLERAARDHIRGSLGRFEVIAYLAERIAIRQAGRLARFDPGLVSPVRSSERVTCRIALITGDADRETPLDGVQKIARFHSDLTVVPGAGHCEASDRLPGGWEGWARLRLSAWGFENKSNR
jgi:pimeloyl-ACP methyl ester carboxylesterase